MSIEIGSKWVKDGEVVEIISRNQNNYENLFNCFVSEYCVWYSKTQEKDVIHVLTERDFLEQYNTFEEPKKTVVIEKWLCHSQHGGFLPLEGDKDYFLTVSYAQVKLLDTYEVTL